MTESSEQAHAPAGNEFASRPWLSAYSPGVPADIPPVQDSLVAMMSISAKTYPGAVALDFFGATTTYEQLDGQIGRAANALRSLGVSPGDRIALVLPSCPQHVVAFHAVLRIGAIVVEHNPLYTPTELQRQFEDHGAHIAIVWDKLASVVAAFPTSVGVRTVIAVNMIEALPAIQRMALHLPIPAFRARRDELTSSARVLGVLAWKDLLTQRPDFGPLPVVDQHDIAVLQYTSGTTGAPKGAILSHANLRANTAQGEAWLPGLVKGEETFYGVLPMFHAFGLTLCLDFALAVGARLVLFPRFEESLVLAAMRRVPATFLPAVPTIYERLIEAARDAPRSLQGIRYGFSGAMPLPPTTVDAWEQLTGGVLVEGYGMTEASPIIACNPVSSLRRTGTVGLPFPGTDIRVVDPQDSHVDRGSDEPGELLVRGPQVFRSYWHRDEETASAFVDGEWLRTGDLVSVSPDGFITILDRLKELIDVDGFKVSPSEVEAVLLAYPGVSDAAVVGLPDKGGSERVVAVVVLESDAALDEGAIKAHCRTVLAGYKVPRTVTTLSALPHSLLGKVERRRVREILLGRP